jgi:transposase InsO family protein
MFNRAIARQTMPKYLSSDHDPLFRFQRWRANLRILEIDEIKSIPCTPRSHAFIERLIGTIRREYLDQTPFWNQGDLERKLDSYRVYYNRHRCHTGLAGITRLCAVALLPIQSQTFTHTAGENTATASFRPRPPLELYFATHRLFDLAA